ncbi:NAD(P)-dependent dehydrogenase, short-chain alcohol dehydrogenase family [Limimonas halophila]|uniref:NAD(P)-dependent dehydrogenase, short-chain alcohol dehydrogenase family n=1 Tax=Limimonas halophila TaxID=1082479 RepID=A0A1G7LTU9_9PROT|nr:SDR family oxidoreductase [Limimonas halophila]SDF52998.1 NAD(P)-dependent dehydrogenase, short-chain alcohol dehydrogenase family [Limimonas halophila]
MSTPAPTDRPGALVTGAARRIGAAIARDLAGQGWAVAVHYNSSEAEAAETVAAIRAAGGVAAAVAANLSDEAETQGLVPRAANALGRPLTCLVNNASVFEWDDVHTAGRASWDRHLDPNLRAPFVLTQRLAEQLPDDARGAVINILDAKVWNLAPGFTSYTVSKAGLWALTQTLALELAPRIRVNAVGPGPTLPSVRQTPADFARQAGQMPLGHGSSPEEICQAVQFILAARSVTGQMIALDGGQHLGWAQPGADPTVE